MAIKWGLFSWENIDISNFLSGRKNKKSSSFT